MNPVVATRSVAGLLVCSVFGISCTIPSEGNGSSSEAANRPDSVVDGDPGKPSPVTDLEVAASTIPAELRDADAVLDARETAGARSHALGEYWVSEDGGSVAVLNAVTAEARADGGPSLGPSDADERLVYVAVRIENRSAIDGMAPGFEIRCSNHTERGTWYLGSTYQPYQGVPSGTFREGEILLGLPKDCLNPAVWADVTDAAYWPLDFG